MRFRYIIIAFFGILLIGGAYSCSKSSASYGTAPLTTTTPPVVAPTNSIQVRTDSHFGSVITDSSGKSLYFFAADVSGSSKCTGTCIVNWPAFYVATPTLDTGLVSSDFSTITRPDGTKQTAYKGWPLYYYIGDAVSGDIKGDGIARIFFVAKPDYTVMMAETQLIGNNGILYDSTLKAATGATIYMTDDRGVTLYRFANDKSGINNFTKSDFSNDATFPIVRISTVQSVPSTLDKSAFSSITVFGQPQLTYKGWPVYKFGLDSLIRGNTKAVSIPTPGIWPVMNEYSPTAP
jgi:predicted lipoprotein with Yx(FWY)xxD motif